MVSVVGEELWLWRCGGVDGSGVRGILNQREAHMLAHSNRSGVRPQGTRRGEREVRA